MPKTVEWYWSRGYIPHPVVSFVLTCYNMVDATLAKLPQLRSFPDSELIVLDDTANPDIACQLARELTGVNECFIHTNDIYFIAACNHAFDAARGKYVLTIQDDDGMQDVAWIKQGLEILERQDRLAFLGGRDAVHIAPNSYSVVARNIGGHQQPFRFVQTVNAAPVFYRKEAWREMGGFSLAMLPTMWEDSDLDIRGWLSHWWTGWYPAGMGGYCWFVNENRHRRSEGIGIVGEMSGRNLDYIQRTYGPSLDEIDKEVNLCNFQASIQVG